MIHIAPCSCELHVRIRELEAVIAAGTEYTGQILARAEKAEARVGEYYEIVVKLNARVAELEKELRSTVSCTHHEMPERWYSGEREEPLDVTQERLHAQDEEGEEC